MNKAALAGRSAGSDYVSQAQTAKGVFPEAGEDHRLFTTKDPFIAAYIAKPRSGKTHAIRYLLDRHIRANHVCHGWVFCATKFNGSYDHLPDDTVLETFDVEDIADIMAYQKKHIGRDGKCDRPCFILFDDMVNCVPWKNDAIGSLFMNYRHYNIRIIIASQYFRKMPPQITEQISFVVAFNSISEKALDALRDKLFPEYGSRDVAAIMKRNTGDFWGLIIDQEADEAGRERRFRAPEKYRVKKIDAWWPDRGGKKNDGHAEPCGPKWMIPHDGSSEAEERPKECIPASGFVDPDDFIAGGAKATHSGAREAIGQAEEPSGVQRNPMRPMAGHAPMFARPHASWPSPPRNNIGSRPAYYTAPQIGRRVPDIERILGNYLPRSARPLGGQQAMFRLH